MMWHRQQQQQQRQQEEEQDDKNQSRNKLFIDDSSWFTSSSDCEQQRPQPRPRSHRNASRMTKTVTVTTTKTFIEEKTAARTRTTRIPTLLSSLDLMNDDGSGGKDDDEHSDRSSQNQPHSKNQQSPHQQSRSRPNDELYTNCVKTLFTQMKQTTSKKKKKNSSKASTMVASSFINSKSAMVFVISLIVLTFSTSTIHHLIKSYHHRESSLSTATTTTSDNDFEAATATASFAATPITGTTEESINSNLRYDLRKYYPEDDFPYRTKHVRGSLDRYTPIPSYVVDPKSFLASGKGSALLSDILSQQGSGWLPVTKNTTVTKYVKIKRYRRPSDPQQRPTTTDNSNAAEAFTPSSPTTTPSNAQIINMTVPYYHQMFVYHRFRTLTLDQDKIQTALKPWQRFSRIPRYSSRWEDKDSFLDGFRQYAKKVYYQHQQEPLPQKGRQRTSFTTTTANASTAAAAATTPTSLGMISTPSSTPSSPSELDDDSNENDNDHDHDVYRQVLWFLPETYRITNDVNDRRAFQKLLGLTDGGTSSSTKEETKIIGPDDDKDKHNNNSNNNNNNNNSLVDHRNYVYINDDGMNHPWVLKQVDLNNGEGITILPPQSNELRTVIDRVVTLSSSSRVVAAEKTNVKPTTQRNDGGDINNDDREVGHHDNSNNNGFVENDRRGKKNGGNSSITSTKSVSSSSNNNNNSTSSSVTSSTYVIQKYICNELTWYGGEKFDLRFFWLVVSVDPLIVLFEDGYVRVSATTYNEHNFSSVTGHHLTNHLYRRQDGTDNNMTSSIHLWNRIQDHYESHKVTNPILSSIDDPIRHVRNQMKHSIGVLAAAFEPNMLNRARAPLTVRSTTKRNNGDGTAAATTTTRRPVRFRAENFFGLYGCDFIIDADLDVYLIESQASPGLPDHRVKEWERLFIPMMDTVYEIATKQSTNASANIFPLQNLGGWEVVYASGWKFDYAGYERSNNKTSCNHHP